MPHMTLPPAPRTEIDFSGESDADLLGFMGMKEAEPNAARDAFAEFYFRHVRWLYAAVCKRRVANLIGGEEGAKDVTQETFRRSYLGAHTFDSGGSADPDTVRRRIRAWLGGIANNVIRDSLRSPDGMSHAVPISELLNEPIASPQTMTSPKVTLVRDALETLGEREKDVVLEAAYHFKLGERHQRLSNETSAALAERWNTTPENIRAIRSRAFKKIKEAIEARLIQTSRS